MRYLIKFRHGRRDQPKIALTFDDGPSMWTESILDILKERSIPATFFLIPENVEKLPDVARRILAEGHEIGGHAHQPDGFSYAKALRTKASAAAIRQSLEVAKEVLGLDLRFFRPSPELAFNRGTEKILLDLHLIPVLASAYSRVKKSPDMQAHDIVKGLRGGDIVLLHDGHDLFIDSSRPKDTIRILPSVIDAAKQKGLQFVKVSELLDVPAYMSSFEARMVDAIPFA